MESQAQQAVSRSSDGVQRLVDTVLAGDYCIGCGACAAIADSPLTVELDERKQFIASVGKNAEGYEGRSVLRVCPFSSEGPDETELASELYEASCQHDPALGYYENIYVGRVVDEDYFSAGSSGGLGRWILTELLRQGLVDGAIHVAKHHTSDKTKPLYSYSVTGSSEDVLQTAQSAYHPVEMSRALKDIRSRPGRYVITGVPCFIKAVRRLCREDGVYRDRIQFCIGLICGHLKSRRYAEMIGWQLGVDPSDLGRLDFRRKFPGRKANEKGVAAYSRDNASDPRGVDIVQNLYGTKYGWGFFKPNACDYCDDVFAETADVVVGDAWLPQYLSEGTSLIVTRHATITRIIETAIADGRLALEPLSAEDAARSQDGGLRHRRDGLRYRLHLKERSREWYPPKRVTPSYEHLTPRYRKIFRLRLKIAKASHGAFAEALAANDFRLFRKRMDPIIDKYLRAYGGGWRNLLRFYLRALGLLPMVRRVVKRK